MHMRTTENVTEQDILEIYSELKKYNLSRCEPSETIPIGVFLEDEKGRKQGGLTGETFGNWLCIRYLWIHENIRGQGIGSSILKAAEQEAKNRGCIYAFVDTFHFQAPDFYRKHGYEEVFSLREYPYTGSRHYYTKKLNGHVC